MRANSDESHKAPTLSSKGRELYSYQKHLKMGWDRTMVMGYPVYKKNQSAEIPTELSQGKVYKVFPSQGMGR